MVPASRGVRPRGSDTRHADAEAARCGGSPGCVLRSTPTISVMPTLLTPRMSGGRLLLVDFWTNPTHTQPLAAALLAGEFLMIAGDGDAYSEHEAPGWPPRVSLAATEAQASRGRRQPA